QSSISTFIDRIHEKHYGHTTKSTLSSNTDRTYADHGTVHTSLEAWNIKKICAEWCTKGGRGVGRHAVHFTSFKRFVSRRKEGVGASHLAHEKTLVYIHRSRRNSSYHKVYSSM
ncbi:hypothetical protein IscW_ISCW003369, partial [Ixodes scapularis]